MVSIEKTHNDVKSNIRVPSFTKNIHKRTNKVYLASEAM